jgi:hypothetical protein
MVGDDARYLESMKNDRIRTYGFPCSGGKR